MPQPATPHRPVPESAGRRRVAAPEFPAATILGYPRIGPRRELKRAMEAYWAGKADLAQLRETGRRLRAGTWTDLAGRGLAGQVSNTFSDYDQVLDAALLLGAVPDRYRRSTPEDTVFAAARGADGLAPLRMTKWFDTNYHYLVPEIGPETRFRADPAKPLAEYAEARELGVETRPVLLGPVTFLLLSEPTAGAPAGFTPLSRLDAVLDAYEQILGALADAGAGWVQLDEPALVADRTPDELAATATAYRRLGGLAHRPALFVASYFGALREALPVLAASPVEAIGLDLVRGELPDELDVVRGKVIVAGVVSGRDVWRTDATRANEQLDRLRAAGVPVSVSTSCSLLHVPYDLAAETDLPADLTGQLAFAAQKVDEVVALAAGDTGTGTVPAPVPAAAPAALPPVTDRSPYPVRAAAQAARLALPDLPTTTIGSFPQTGELRAARAELAAGRLDPARYDAIIEAEIDRVLALQEQLGLDVLVHGEPERNDMVQYFAEHLDGFAVTGNGWVQSYGSRCTRPPILHGEVRRTGPITVRWARYAQSRTDRPVKGMLTGPVTIVAWSFVRGDLPLRTVVHQVAEAVRGEVADLEAEGIGIVQVDEPALRELLPLRAAERDDYLDWAVAAYRRATSGAGDDTQIHTHLCYSDADEVLAAIDALDADVTSIESARSHGRILVEPALRSFARGLGPGVYDIHSQRVPSVVEIADELRAARVALPAGRVWANPDCGLKTRGYAEVTEALRNLVAAAREVRHAATVPVRRD
ncbi:5-methyltetrahydropteroyltriglutamate--homocysteine methyltransferase [Actinocatenispora thailandica]|uniref:5-methyltetrahydropteroyltriglutamate--homocysteine S-methyltransferase n=1 Tax=Actinocatenispora thailandica TaxID=227318 RepID=A0A7R7HXB3_9ACTN|nr:5-methyltetrahydropteroyltriglutamate--homocysteine S-methyltransferase [Actinocatenispora thailandica]BCJ35763.1 5-methyltetrahydropteroyltriglutamate--homocysteine methyltransferase [Actinocatenispora thailandica]